MNLKLYLNGRRNPSNRRENSLGPSKKAPKFTHSGLVHSKRDKFAVTDNNAISNTHIKLEEDEIRPMSELRCYTQSVIKKRKNYLISGSKKKLRGISLSKCLNNKAKSRQRNISSMTTESIINEGSKNISLIHPGMTAENKNPDDEFMIINRRRVKTPFCRFKEFTKMPPCNFDIPCIGVGSPYKSPEQIKYEEYNISKRKWITTKGFIRHITKNSKDYQMIKNYVTQDPSQPPILHEFREINKEKWVSGPFKLI